jgi:hypothetical protein
MKELMAETKTAEAFRKESEDQFQCWGCPPSKSSSVSDATSGEVVRTMFYGIGSPNTFQSGTGMQTCEVAD